MHRAIKQAKAELRRRCKNMTPEEIELTDAVIEAHDKWLLHADIHGRDSQQAQEARADLEYQRNRLYRFKCDLVGPHNVIEGVTA